MCMVNAIYEFVTGKSMGSKYRGPHMVEIGEPFAYLFFALVLFGTGFLVVGFIAQRNQTPNQSTDPTASLVTPPAEQESRRS